MTRRAIVFDLDETLYRERRFALSGYRAVARLVAAEFGLDEAMVFSRLAAALRRGRRAGAFQDLAEHIGLAPSCIAAWVEAYRTHQPDLRLQPATRRMLETFRLTWRTGVLTNGLPAVQSSKVMALGLEPLVDAVVYADRFDGGKPSRAAFLEVLARLGADPSRSVLAGDDAVRDIEGARAVGMRTVLVRRGRLPEAGGRLPEADAVIASLAELPGVAERLVRAESQYVH
jgi:putative hydrolase of the HAD superfamily